MSKGTQSKPSTERQTERAQKPKSLPPYHVVLLDDDDHTHEYVMEMCHALFGYTAPRGYLLADAVNTQGRAILLTTHKELAELKRDQIHGFGADWRLENSAGSMNAIIEPAAK